MELHEFLQRVDGVKRQNENQHMARCPAHSDKKASLSISRGKEGQILLHCQAGCSTEEILATIGLKMKDLFPEKPEKKEKASVVCEYLYRDPEGKTIHKKIRKSDKTFLQAQQKAGKWVYNLQGLQTVPYNLPEVTKAILEGSPVYLPEGEKDCDNLVKAGRVASCNTEGAGPGKWKDHYTPYFQGADIIVLPDNDQIGKAFAVEKANALKGVARSVKLADLKAIWPEIPEKGDISDMMVGMGEKEAMELLDKYITTLPEYEPTEGEPVKDDKFFIVPTKTGVCVKPALLTIYMKGKHDLRVFKDQFRIRKNYYYSEVPYMKSLISKEIPEELRVPSNIKDTEELLSFDSGLHLDEKDLAPQNFISFKNGVLNVETMQFMDHEKAGELIFINQVDYNWNPAAKPDKMTDDFFNSICNGNQKDIDFLFQVLGVAMSGYRDFKNFFYFTGLKDTGKSQYLHLIENLLRNSDGTNDYSSIPLRTLTDETSKEFVQIIGKRANISGETPPNLQIRNDALLKAMTGGDWVRAERKFREALTFVNKAMLIFAGNDIPQFFTSDKGSIGERIMIYRFKNAIPPEKQVKSVYQKLDMEYVIQKAAEQLSVFVKNNQRFLEPEEAASNREFMQMESDSIYKFFRLNVVTVDDPKSRISTGDLYQEYLRFMVREGHLELDEYNNKPNTSRFKITRYVFNQNMKKFMGEANYKRKVMYNGEKMDCFINLRLVRVVEEVEGWSAKNPSAEHPVGGFYEVTDNKTLLEM